MTKRLTGFTVLAVTLLVLASVPMFNQPTAVAQSEGGGTGACEAVGLGCLEITADGCTNIGGTWYGVGSFCGPNGPCAPAGFPCPPFSTACCLGDGTCATLIAELCVEAGGTASPTGTPCSAVTCDQPCAADTDGDGTVGILDFLDVLAQWGDCQ